MAGGAGRPSGTERRAAALAGLRRAIVPTVVAVLAVRSGYHRLPYLLGAAAFGIFLLSLVAPRQCQAVERQITRVAGLVLVTGVLLLVEAVIILPASLVALVVRWDPLTGERRRSGPRWDERHRRARRGPAQRAFGTEPRATRGGRRRGRVASGIAVAVVIVAAVVITRDVEPKAPSLGPTGFFLPIAYPDEPWVASLWRSGAPLAIHPTLGWTIANTQSRYNNVRGSVRRSFEPPAPRRTVWFLGGSTLYGLGQRDVHTIPSEVGRLASAAGMPIKVVNFGVPAYLNWQEVSLIGLRLSQGARPDLIVFYDGFNEVKAAQARGAAGMRDLDVPGNAYQDEFEAGVHTIAPEPRDGRPATRAQRIAAATKTYGHSVDLGRRIAASYGVPVMFYSQPWMWTTSPRPWDAEVNRANSFGAGYIEDETAVAAGFRKGLPPGVVDLGDALDGVDEPVFWDGVHTNEVGAKVVAAAMWRTLAARVRGLMVPDGDGPP